MKKITLTILSCFLMHMAGYLEAKNKDSFENINNNYSQRFETKNVQQIAHSGFTFLVANYVDGTRIITCLDGADIGLQVISYNGAYQTESRGIEWQKDGFVHYYQHGKVISYSNRQIIELY